MAILPMLYASMNLMWRPRVAVRRKGNAPLVESAAYNGLVGYYPTTDGNSIGDFTPINDREFSRY